MTNQKMRNSRAYKTYLAYATGATTPKKARKFKKPASPSKKRTLVTAEEEEPGPAKKFALTKKTSRKQSIGLPYLRRLKRRKLLREDNENQLYIKQVAQVMELVFNQRFLMSQKTNDDEKESEDVFVHTPPNYVPTDDETNNESNDVNEKEYDRIEKELYGDVNVRLTDVKQDDEDKEDVDMTDVAHVQVEQTQEQTTGVQEESGLEMARVQGQCMVQATTTATPAIQNATTESTETKVVSMMDINVQHEVPLTTITLLHSSIFPNLHQSTPILTPTNTEATILTHSILEYESLNAIHLRLSDLEKEVKELKNVDHSLALLSKIKSEVPNAIKEYLGTSLDDALYKVLKKHDADIIKEFLVPTKIVERLTQQYLPQQSTKKSTKDIRKIKMEHASKHQVPKFTITSSDTAALEEFDQKTTLFNTMTKSKSFNKSTKHKALYHALMESILKD
ncbi:hypothetical protein Tco_1340256 [Tanacetum coccineum]